jgi:glycosyltransferase involved in cell wall biosynthesis
LSARCDLTVLSVAYPFAPVTADPVGGAEQVLSILDRAVLNAGGRSVVIASADSAPAGEHVAFPVLPAGVADGDRVAVYREIRQVVAEAIGRYAPGVVHLHGLDFYEYLPQSRVPVIVTLHLPLAWYPRIVLEAPRQDVSLVPVSYDQIRRGPSRARLTQPIENGVDVESFPPRSKKHFAVALGRICPEKGFHLALDAAKRADLPMVLAGSVFPYPEHKRYFAQEILPRIDRRRHWIGAVAGAAKRRLLAAAQCLLVTSLAPETSCLVAREALAAGTPVVALRGGALGDVVEPGRTGFFADTPEELPRAIREAAGLDPEDCRSAARARFSAQAMVDCYLDAYRCLAAGDALHPARESRAA